MGLFPATGYNPIPDRRLSALVDHRILTSDAPTRGFNSISRLLLDRIASILDSLAGTIQSVINRFPDGPIFAATERRRSDK